MHSTTSKALFTLSLLRLLNAVSAQVPATASPLDLGVVDQQYIYEGFPNTDQTVGFGVNLEAQAIMTLIYDGVIVAPGQALTHDQVAAFPSIYVTPSADHLSNFTSGSTFTLTLADASAVGHPDPQGNFRHYLANGIHGAAPATSGANNTFALSRDGADTITFYAGPGPNAGEGPHRYAFLLFQQPSSFAAPTGLAAASTPPSHWSVQSYVSSSHLGSLVAAAFFTVENGQATYSVAPTSTVNPATIVVPGATTTSSGGGSAATTTTSSSAGAPAETSSGGGSGAGMIKINSGLVGLGLVVLSALAWAH